MSVKLSELFSKAADDVFERSYDCPIDESTAIRTRSRTLRAIAPAMVEAFKIMGDHYQAHPHSNCPSCRLFAVLKAAGVTCE